MSNDWTQGGVREVLVNPYHCLSKPAHNVRPNAKLITQMGSEGYLNIESTTYNDNIKRLCRKQKSFLIHTSPGESINCCVSLCGMRILPPI